MHQLRLQLQLQVAEAEHETALSAEAERRNADMAALRQQLEAAQAAAEVRAGGGSAGRL